jgi:type I restriction enzyme, S subunit
VITDLKPYREYKDSGLAWLGQVPRRWDMRPAFGAFMPIHERNHGMKEKTVLSLSYGRIVIKPAEKLHGLVPESFETYQIVNPGDIILRTTDLQNDHTSLRVGMVRDRGIITSAYLALRVSAGVNEEFGFQFLNVWDTSKAIYGYGSGLRQNLDFAHFKRMPVAVPPPTEQAAIVRFLDWSNGRLERTIRAKKKVIALLNEQKQAIIHRAVTRGLDPSAPLKPSGIPWLGDIPLHWNVVSWRRLILSLKDFGSNGSFAGLRENVRYLDHPDYARLVRLTDLRKGLQENEGIYVSEASYRYLAQSALFGGELLIANVGAHAGYVCQMPKIDRPATLGPNMMFAKKINNTLVDTAYLVLSAQSDLIQRQLRLIASQSAAQPKLDKDEVRSVVTPLPPRMEQERIVSQIRIDTEAITAAISRLEREIEFFREYRIRLVADVVTGKLDVRETASRLPEERERDSVEDDADPSADLENAAGEIIA